MAFNQYIPKYPNIKQISQDQNFGRGGVLKNTGIAPCTTPGGKFFWTSKWRLRTAEDEPFTPGLGAVAGSENFEAIYHAVVICFDFPARSSFFLKGLD
jgi:hypothetical protein